MKGYEETKMDVLEIEANVVVPVSTLEGAEFGICSMVESEVSIWKQK